MLSAYIGLFQAERPLGERAAVGEASRQLLEPEDGELLAEVVADTTRAVMEAATELPRVDTELPKEVMDPRGVGEPHLMEMVGSADPFKS